MICVGGDIDVTLTGMRETYEDMRKEAGVAEGAPVAQVEAYPWQGYTPLEASAFEGRDSAREAREPSCRLADLFIESGLSGGAVIVQP